MMCRLLFCSLFIPLLAGAQAFVDVTPGNLPAMESGDVAWADYNKDGYLDFAIMGSSGTSAFSGIYTGLGTGSFQFLPTHGMPPMASGDLDWGDFDNDGDLDLAMIGRTNVSPYDITVILRNNITSFEQVFVTYGSLGGSLTWMDYDNDRDLDLYQVGSFFNNYYPNTIFINSDGNFSATNSFGIKGYGSELAIDNSVCTATDFDQDGDQDILSSGKYSYGVWSVASLLVNNGVLNIENTNQYRFSYNDIAVRSGSVNQGDFNKDAKMDYFITGNHSSVDALNIPYSQLLLGTGNGNFIRRGGLLDVYNSSSDVGDLDNDGDLDIVISGQTASGPLARIYRNDGSGNFGDAGITNLVGLSLCTVALADYDNDGDLDILMMGRDQNSAKTIKLYQNTLLSKATSPNTKPAPPANLRFSMENNSVILEWDKASDQETPAASLTYNAYVSLAPKTPFKLFPQADANTGERRVFEPGNASCNTRIYLKNLLTGTYTFSVQTIDGANEGSPFAAEVSFKYIRIDAAGPDCENSEQVLSVTPPGNYTWTLSGGKIISGQGSEKLRIKWDKLPVNPRVTVSAPGSSNSYVPQVIALPSARIMGPNLLCDVGGAEYHPAVVLQNVSYSWNIDGRPFDYATPSISWTTPGNKLVTMMVTDPSTGCSNYDTLHTVVSEKINVAVSNENGVYTIVNSDPSYQYKWEQFANGTLTTVSTSKNFNPVNKGSYIISVFNRYGCQYGLGITVNQVVTGIEQDQARFQLVPNPATARFSAIHLPKSGRPVRVTVIDIAGRNLFSGSTTDDNLEIDGSTFERGIYLVLMQTETEVQAVKIVIR